MKRLVKPLFYCILLILWVVMIALGLEVWERVRRQRIESANPYVLARRDKGVWPVTGGKDAFSPELENIAARDQLRGAGQSTVPQPVPDDREMAGRRSQHFALLDDWERYAFTTAYRVKALLVDGRGMVVKAYSEVNYPGGKTPADFVGPDDAPRIVAALPGVAGGGPPTVLDGADGKTWFCLASCPNPGPPGPDGKATPPYVSLCWPDSAAPVPEEKSLWDRPFFSYRPHQKREAQLNVLGVSEQFAVNNVGLRDDDVILPKPPGVFRILCMGASTTEEGPTNDLTYPNILESLANARFGGQHVDVVNAGISGMNSLKHKIKLADYLALQPDLIVIYSAVNDICHDLFPMWVKDAGDWQKRLRESRFLNDHFNAWLLPDEKQMTADIRRAKIANLRFIIEQARAAGVESVLLTFAAPAPEKLDRVGRDYMDCYTQLEWGGRYVTFASYLRALGLFNQQIEVLGGEMGTPIIDVAGRLRGGTEFFGDICHMKNRGIEAKARLVFDNLAPLLEDRLHQCGFLP